ncbi:hypothetical protein [Flavobacterium davisii]
MKNLEYRELVDISGGSEISDAFWYGVGVVVRCLEGVQAGAVKGSANRFN